MDKNTVAVLKCLPDAFQAIWDGKKRAEFRMDDRMYGAEKLYKEDRLITLQEYVYETDTYRPRMIDIQITDVRRSVFSIPDGFCMFSFRVLICRDFSARDEYQDALNTEMAKDYRGGPRSAQIAWREGFEAGVERKRDYLLLVDRLKLEQAMGVTLPKETALIALQGLPTLKTP